VTFKLTQGHRQSCHSIGHIISYLSSNCHYVSILHRFRYIIAYFRKLKDVVTTPMQGTVCNPNAESSHGKPVHEIWSL